MEKKSLLFQKVNIISAWVYVRWNGKVYFKVLKIRMLYVDLCLKMNSNNIVECDLKKKQ